MKPGKVALLRFPHANLVTGKLRPVLLIARVPGPYYDWLVAMISTNLEQALPGFDEVITRQDYDFIASGLKEESAIRIGRLAVAEAGLLLGEIGEISSERLNRIQKRIADWIMGVQEFRSEVNR
ncbi:MAG TPA: type II toxin-antitoxin system PemK/MazF family toxin [Candidatus Atribacteria bacterium]|nr:type II toxin-antitoxin system PemK/MazF family toxin [Candidatus Atribacteria bacterium]